MKRARSIGLVLSIVLTFMALLVFKRSAFRKKKIITWNLYVSASRVLITEQGTG